MSSSDLVNYIAGLELPSCSMLFNGLVLEEEVPGYRTMNVTGRDSLAAELAEYDNGYVDGSTLLNRKFPSRDIQVNFSLTASSVERLRKAFDKLRGLLYSRDSKEVQIVFKDEADVFYLGTVTEVTGDESVEKETAYGSISIHCNLPYKWSIDEFVANADADGNIIVDYDGTYKAYPVLHARINNESLGYIGFVNDQKAIIQLGRNAEEELDADQKSKSLVLVDDDFVKFPERLNERWPLKNQIVHENRSVINRDQQIKDLIANVNPFDLTNIGNGVTRNWNITPNHANSILSTNTNARWAGGSRVQVLPQPATDFTCTMNYVINDIKANVTNNAYHGEVRIHLSGMVNGIKRHIACMHAYINTDTNNKVRVNWTVLDTQYGEELYTPTEQKNANLSNINSEDLTPEEKRNKFKAFAKTLTITKQGSNFIFNSPIGKKTVKIAGSENYEVTEIGIWILGLAKVESISTQVKTPSTTFVDGKKFESGSIHVRSEPLPSSVVVPTSKYPMQVTIYGEKNTVTKVSGKIYSTTKTKTVTIKIAKTDTNYKTGLLDTVVHYNKTNRRINLVAGSKKSDGYKWYIRGTYYYTGPKPDRRLIDSMGIRSVKFVKNNYNAYSEIPNPITKGDQIDVDCNTGEILVNGLSNYNLGALGNDWEEFCIYPGGNVVNCSFSEWASEDPNFIPPDFYLTYRKVFI